MEKWTRRKYTTEFKQQMVILHASGKPASEIIREYELTASTFHKWIKQFNQTGYFKETDNRETQKKKIYCLTEAK